MKKNRLIPWMLGGALVFGLTAHAQKSYEGRNYQELPWKVVATQMPDEWYGTDEAKAAADNVLVYQKWSGGWGKNTPMHKTLRPADRSALIEDKRSIHNATFDNDATTTELKFLAKVYNKTGEDRYKEAFEDGLIFIFRSQYDNGGWPQVWPLRPGYYSHITINDDATYNNLVLLQRIVKGDPEFAFLDKFFVERSRKVMDRGVDCLLKTQIVKGGKPTVWCAQHDEYNFMPSMGRTFELPSFSGSESVNVVLFLMSLENPSPEVIRAVECAVEWFESHKLEGIRVATVTGPDGRRDRQVVQDPNAPALWGRFYDLETEKPFFCDRDGVKKNSLAEVGYERRNGYGWYTSGPQKVLDAYPAWKARLVR